MLWLASGSCVTVARTGSSACRRSWTNASASGARSTATTVPWAASQAPLPPGPHPASRMVWPAPSQGPSRSAISARVLRYHQCPSSTAAMRAYSATSTGADAIGGSRSVAGDAEGVDRDLGGRAGLDAEALAAARFAPEVEGRLVDLVDVQHDRVVDHHGELAVHEGEPEGPLPVQQCRVLDRCLRERLPVLV